MIDGSFTLDVDPMGRFWIDDMLAAPVDIPRDIANALANAKSHAKSNNPLDVYCELPTPIKKWAKHHQDLYHTALTDGFSVQVAPRYLVYVPHADDWIYHHVPKQPVYPENGSKIVISSMKEYQSHLAYYDNHINNYTFTPDEINEFGLNDCKKVEVSND